MICPDCAFDNIAGVDLCEECGQPLTDTDLNSNELELAITRHPVSALAPKHPVSISSDSTVQQAIDQMVSHKIGCLLVESDDELVGIFTERDVLNKVSGALEQLESPVSDSMTASPMSLTEQDSIAYALHAMDLGGYRHLPVIDEEKRPIGIISSRDILRYLCIRFAELRPQVN